MDLDCWWIGKDDFGRFYFHVGNGAGSEGMLRIYPDLGLGVVVMSNTRGYQRDKIVGGLVNAWMNQNRIFAEQLKRTWIGHFEP